MGKMKDLAVFSSEISDQLLLAVGLTPSEHPVLQQSVEQIVDALLVLLMEGEDYKTVATLDYLAATAQYCCCKG